MKKIHQKTGYSTKCDIAVNPSHINLFQTKLKVLAGFVLFFIFIIISSAAFGQAAASFNYDTQTGTLGNTYSWIDCSGGTEIVSGDDSQASFYWPFDFSFYDNTYTTANVFSVATNGFIRLDGTANTSYAAASAYNLTATATELGQIIALAVYDGKVGDNGGWVRGIVTGSAPNRIMTIEFNNLEIDYDDNKYANVQVSFYETLNKIVLKFGTDNVTVAGADMGIHSGVSGYFNKWQEVASGTNNTWIEYIPTSTPTPPAGPAASWNYNTLTGTLGTTYSWISCSAGANIVSGDDARASISWPFNFNFYDNSYTTADNLSVCTNGFICLDGDAGTNYATANAYTLSGTSTELGQIIAMGVYDGKVGDNGGWTKSLVTGNAPNRIFTIEYNNLEINYNASKYASLQVSFYETLNKIVLKFGADNVTQAGADMGIHSGVSGYFNKWQEVASGTNNTWIEYTPPNIEVNATIGTSLAYYPTLKNAFDKINDGTHQGNITLKIKHNTIESSSAILNASGTGGSNYASVNIYPTETGLSISGSLATPLIDLNGADNVTIDGRVNATGTVKDLSIINLSTASVANTSTLRFVNDATNNSIKYCIIKGAETTSANLNPSGGLIYFATGTSGGNDNNTIDNNTINSVSDASRPIFAIYSYGTPGKENSGITISNNEFYDVLNKNTTSSGIFFSSYTTNGSITGNSFYETNSFSPVYAVTYNAIQIKNTSGGGFVVSDNYIGGSAALCGGTVWTKTNSANNIFNAINLNVGTTTASSVQNNTIQNFSWNNSGSAAWTGIAIAGGDVNIGTTTGNTIGATTGTGSVTVTGANSGLNVYGISITGTGTVDCRNNTIGAITSANGATLASNIYGIYKSATAGTTTISHNTIGSNVTANSINASSASTGNAQLVYGIYNAGTGSVNISNNTISKLNNGTTHTSIWTRGVIHGIKSVNGTITIANNTIYDLSIANANRSERIDATNNPPVCGIALSGTANAKTVTGNTIYNLSNSYASFGGNVMGIYFIGGTTANNVSGNFIHSLSVTGASSTSANIYGIKIASGVTTYSNNIISLGGDTKTTVYGIYETGAAGNNNSLYFNTVYIGGNLASGSTNKSYALYSAVSTNVRNFRNNIFMNARATTAGANLHYAAYFNYAVNTSLTADYNNYYVAGTGGVLGYYGANKTSLPIITGQDVNSLNTDPNFTSPGGTTAIDYVTSVSLPGVAGTVITTDYNDIIRNDPPKMGALESDTDFVWQGNTSTDFATASNWVNGAVPPDGVNISFAATPANDCYLDQNRTLNNITNTSAKKFVVNGNQLTISGNIISATANQIDASSASSLVVFAGTTAQNIPAGAFASNTIDGLTLNNSNGITQNGPITIQMVLTLTNGALSIGANTLTLNGSVSTAAGTLTGGSTSNISIGGSGANTTLPGVLLNNLTINRANGISLGGSVSVSGTLTLTNGTLTVGANTLTISGNAPAVSSGNIDAGDTSATVVFSNASAITLAASFFTGDINNLTINGAGITAVNDLTINGILNLQSANPSTPKGCLDMGIFTLNMGASATTIGIGDVTGIVKRTSFVDNVNYSFGNEFTTITFAPGGTFPTDISIKIVIGTAPAWKSDAVMRSYDIVRTGGDAAKITMLSLHYLDTELNANAENEIVIWDYHSTVPKVEEHGVSNSNYSENWLSIGNRKVTYFGTSFDEHPWGISKSLAPKFTWQGSASSDWNDVNNWSGGEVPTSTSDVIIPNAETTLHDPTLPASASINRMEIQAGGILNGGSSTTLTVVGALEGNGAWVNEGGTFNPNTSTVIFTYSSALISGHTNFYNLTIDTGAELIMSSGSYIGIAGSVTNNGTWRTVIGGVTVVEYNGAEQTVINPNGAIPGYYKLILSGSGTKTMPATAMNIADEFVLTGTVTATAQSSLTVGSEFEIINGATFATGSFNHSVGGHFDVSGHLGDAGTFTPTPGTTITLNGTTVQNIYGGSAINFENLIINNSAGVDIFTDIVVNDELTLTNGNLNVGATTLTMNGEVVKTGGFINVTELSSLYFGGTTAFSPASALFLTPPIINNFTINRTGGVADFCSVTVNGILNLQSANPSSTLGCLDMGINTLTMGENSTTIGIGDVTGIVRREHYFDINMVYTFGSQYTTFAYIDGNQKPAWISVKISIGTVPDWATWPPDGKVKRQYQVASSANGSTSLATINMRYLTSELDATYNDETKLVFWHKFLNGTPNEYGKSDQDLINHTLEVTGLPIGAVTTENLDDSQVGLAYSSHLKNTWKGSVVGFETEWEQAYNWTGGHVPTSADEVLIPGGLTYYPSLTASSNAVANIIEIEPGASITANSYNIIIYGSGGSWINHGTFYPGSGKVTFNHGILSEVVTVAGTTNFYNIEVGANTTMQPVAGSTLRIAGFGTADQTSIIDFSTIENTVEWNGADQTIVVPNGIDGNSGYYNLILSGSGTKTMQGTALNILGNFKTAGTAAATAAGAIKVNGNTTIETGSTFYTGSFNHLLAGNFENNGTFTASSGSTITLNGTTAQTISGTSTTSFDNLTIDNILGVTQSASVNINNVLLLSGGNLIIGNTTLGINGTISNPGGAIEVSESSNLNFGGTSALTINNNLFSSTPSINTLTINRTGGVTMGNQSMTVNGALDLQAGTLTLAANTLTIAGSNLTRTTGTMNAANTGATLVFANSAAITLPASVFNGNINNLTVSGAGVNAGGDISINGILNLSGANQSATVGSLNMVSYTLNMGALATTAGTGDVTGIVRRQHTFLNGVEYTFGNQYTSLNFLGVPGGIKPTWVSCKIEIGTAPVWRTTNVKRIYSFLQEGGTDRTYAKLHYLDSELDASETDEGKIIMYTDKDGLSTGDNTVSIGKSSNDAGENWVELLGMAINQIATSSTTFAKEYGLGYTNVSKITWTGLGAVLYPGDWSLPGNWLGGVPTATDEVLIPAGLSTAYPYRNLLSSISPSQVKTLEIESGATISASDFNISVSGDANAWVNNGTFNAGTSTVIFNNGNSLTAATIAGNTNFYNLTVSDNSKIQTATGSSTGIGGSLSIGTGSTLDFSSNANTVIYNGNSSQNILSPNGGATPGYYHLSLSSGGTKTFPASTLKILGDLTVNSNIITSGNTIEMSGSVLQAISGSNATEFNNLTIDNANVVLLNMDQLTKILGTFQINAGKKMEIAANNKLTVVGSVINNGGNNGLTLISNSTGSASLIHNTNGVAATMERYIGGAAENWHFLSSPVANQTIAGSSWVPSGTYGNLTGYDLYVWDEPTPCWVYQLNTTVAPNWPTVHPSANFVPGRGYLYSVQAANATKAFAGNLNNGSVSYSLTADGSTDVNLLGFNLVGNPYPSSIDWMAAKGWTRGNLMTNGGGNDMWIWNPEAENYGVYNSADATGVGTNAVTRYIPAMQGFFVRAQTAGNLETTNDVRVHDAITLWKSGQIETNRFIAVVYSETDQTFDEVRLLFGYPENKAGAAKLFSPVTTAPSLYLPEGEANFTIRYLTDAIANPHVPLLFKAGRDGFYTINFDFDNYGFKIAILEDRQTGEFTDLTLAPDYRFRASKKDNENRFIIHFGAIPANENRELPAHIYSSGGELVIDLTLVNELTEVKVVDVLGRTILQKGLNGNTIHRLQLNAKSQVFIVYAQTKNNRISKKVVVY